MLPRLSLTVGVLVLLQITYTTIRLPAVFAPVNACESVVPELTSLALACTNAGVAACASASGDRTSIAPSAQASAAIRKTARWLTVAPMDISRSSACQVKCTEPTIPELQLDVNTQTGGK